MIFATVGTHEQPFDRLLHELDRLVEVGTITEPVFIQASGCAYTPRHCTVEALLPYERMDASFAEARIAITAAGPATIMLALKHGKVPIVVPRQSAFGEHVDDHQVRFARRMADRVLVVEDIRELGPTILHHAERVAGLGAGEYGPERARRFAERFDALCEDVLAAAPRKPLRAWLLGRPG